MMRKATGFLSAHKKVITTTLVTMFLTGAIPTTVWIHNAYADARYVQKTDDLRQQIQQIDNALFEIDQEISFAVSEAERRKWQARKAYYERQKAALAEKLKAATV
ncbi:MAG: hypothetical protein V3U60_11310 [Gammaproteobacteria bacterium]